MASGLLTSSYKVLYRRRREEEEEEGEG